MILACPILKEEVAEENGGDPLRKLGPDVVIPSVLGKCRDFPLSEMGSHSSSSR